MKKLSKKQKKRLQNSVVRALSDNCRYPQMTFGHQADKIIAEIEYVGFEFSIDQRS